MNIIEAVKSGKRFRRTSWEGNVWFKTSDIVPWSKSDILADDWEVEEKQVTITESQFEEALNRTSDKFNLYNPPHICEYLSQLKKELGL
jgi:hypothetical protein